MSITLTINGSTHQVDLPAEVPLLWAIRDGLGMTGTKFGCGVAACGACTVMIDGEAVRSCQLPLGDAVGQPGNLAVIQQAWIKHQVAQCGYCQSGQIMQATALLATNPDPTDQDIDDAMQGNLCRCGTYPRIRAAILDAAQMMKAG
jgi:isoquinoline 1-oxidoreductase alpha subunit